MSHVATTVIVLALVVLYLWVGVRFVAPAHVTRKMNEHILNHPGLAKDPEWLGRRREGYIRDAMAVALLWPLPLVSGVVRDTIDGRAQPTDHEVRLELEERERHVAELEKKLGITEPEFPKARKRPRREDG